ncbi:MAG: hypothetical protein KF690_11105 [Bacteroidetes bacterium]|nr:hypothetical protein [Bacteroidota bacterium]
MHSRLLWLLLLLLPARSFGQAQPMGTARMFLFQSGLALTLKEGNLKLDNGRLLIEDIPEALFNCFWLNPAGNYNILKTVYGADTVLRDAEARNFFDILKANVGKEARITYKVDKEVEDVEGTVMPFGINSDLARIQRATGGTIFIQRDQVLMVSINDPMARTLYQEMVIGNSTAVEIDKNMPFASLQALFFQKGFAWEPSYSLLVRGDRSAALSLKAIIHSKGHDITHSNIKLVIGSPVFRSDKGIDGSMRELINALPTYSFPKPIGANNLVQVITGEEQNTEGVPGRTLLSPALLGYDGRTHMGEMYILDAGSMSLKKNSKAYLPVFDNEVTLQQSYACSVPNYVADPQLPAQKVPLQTLDAYLNLSMRNPMGFPLLPGAIFVTDEKAASLGQDEMPYTPADSVFTIRLQKVNNLVVTTEEDVYTEELRVRLEDKSIVDRITVRGTILVKNTDKKPIIIQVSKDLTGIVNRKSGATLTQLPGKAGLNPLVRMEWSLPVPGQAEQRIPYEYAYYRQP